MEDCYDCYSLLHCWDQHWIVWSDGYAVRCVGKDVRMVATVVVSWWWQDVSLERSSLVSYVYTILLIVK